MFDKYSKLEKYIKIVKNFVAGAFLSIPLILGSCDYIISPSENSDSSLKNFRKTTLGSGYEMPEGLSSYNEKELLKQTDSDNFQVFTTRPTFIPDITLDKMVFHDKPSVYKVLPNLSVEKLYEFNNEDIDEFLSLHFTFYDSLGNRFERPMGNSLDALLLKDKSTLISSNVSWKIFRINSSGEKETYLEDPELVGIRDMMLSKDNKIYFVQDALYERINDSTIIITTRPKRAMSIDSLKNINFEFELPDKKSSYSLLSVRAENPLYAGNRSQLGGQLKIVENSQKGKKQTGIDFFVSDFLENRIYDVRKDSSMYSVDIFKENLVAPPVAIKTDNQGNLYVLTSPLLNPDTTIVSQEPMILSIDSTRVATPIYSFSSENFDFSGPEYFEEGLSGRFSRLFSCSMNLFETDIDVAFFITLSHNGKLLKLEATKP